MGRSAKVIRALCFAAAAMVARSLPASEPALVGRELDYTVRRGDTLTAIGARFGVGAEALAARNGLSLRKRLIAGRVLRVDNRHIVPAVLENGILINVPQRLLFYFEEGRVVAWYPVALGQPGSWQTPTGSYQVLTKERNPVWDVPLSIQREMRAKGERVRTKVPPGPDNPLGRHWLGLSLECCGIHSTNAPGSIYRFETHGCIRLAERDAMDLFSRAPVGSPVEIVYEPVMIARDTTGSLFVEVHPDVYSRAGGPYDPRKDVDRRDLTSASRSPAWEEALQKEEGIATPLTFSGGRSGSRTVDTIRESAASRRR